MGETRRDNTSKWILGILGFFALDHFGVLELGNLTQHTDTFVVEVFEHLGDVGVVLTGIAALYSAHRAGRNR